MAKPPTPTEAELRILQILWSRGPSTVRDVLAAMDRGEEVGYTTVLKFLQIMHEKRLVRRDASERAHVYQAAVAEDAVQRDLVEDVLERVFGGSAEKLILRALSVKGSSQEELDEIRKLLDRHQGRD